MSDPFHSANLEHVASVSRTTKFHGADLFDLVCRGRMYFVKGHANIHAKRENIICSSFFFQSLFFQFFFFIFTVLPVAQVWIVGSISLKNMANLLIIHFSFYVKKKWVEIIRYLVQYINRPGWNYHNSIKVNKRFCLTRTRDRLSFYQGFWKRWLLHLSMFLINFRNVLPASHKYLHFALFQ